MVVQVHGFDWVTYTEHIMPAFGQWFIQRDESAIYQLFTETRYAHEETFVPAVLLSTRIWPRVKAFVETLPLGPYSRREYQRLCSAEHFTSLSDRYVFKHVPQLYQNPEAIRAIWGALIETHCLPWSFNDYQQPEKPKMEEQKEPIIPFSVAQAQIERNEVITLLREAGLSELFREMNEERGTFTEPLRRREDTIGPDTQPLVIEPTNWRRNESELAPERKAALEMEESENEDEIEAHTRRVAGGISIGMASNVLQMRGWLAGISVRAMVLFEYLACGRRCMPFGYEPNEAHGIFIGYLTPNEVWHLGTCLRGASHPDQAEAESDYLHFRHQHSSLPESYRLLDEVLPFSASDFHWAIDMAAAQGLGLICSVA